MGRSKAAIFEHTGRKMPETMRYPLTAPVKFFWFPHKWLFYHCRGIRFWMYCSALSLPIFMGVDSIVNAPAAIEYWEQRHKDTRHHMTAWKETPTLESSHHQISHKQVFSITAKIYNKKIDLLPWSISPTSLKYE